MIQKIFTGILVVLLIGSCQTNLDDEKKQIEKDHSETVLTVGLMKRIKSEVLNEERSLIIALPKDYDDSSSNYPVLYLTDGLQNIWHVTGALEVLARTGSVPPMIVVGIESTNRMRDFTLTKSENHPGSGGGKRFLSFIQEELIPYVESNYRTNAYRVLEGHSLGGLFAASTLVEQPDLFDSFIVMSPSLWWNGEELTGKSRSFFKDHPDLNKAIFFGIGTAESGVDYGMRKELKNFTDMIAESAPKKLRIKRKEMENEGHMAAPLLSNYYGMKYIFSDMAFPDKLFEEYSDRAFLEHEEKIMNKYGGSAKQSAESYVELAFHLRNQERFLEAATVLKRSVNAYLFDVGLMNLLGNTYEQANKTEEAIAVYKQAVETSRRYRFEREEEFEGHIKRLTNE